MHTQASLEKDLATLGVDPNGTLMVHISYKSVGAVEGGGDAVLDALSDYMRDGLLVLPAHTWNNVNAQNPVMDVLLTPVCVGYLPEAFRKREGVKRSLHPTHSLAALGRDAEAFAAGDELTRTPCAANSTYHKLYERGAQILLIGVDFTRNTYIHGLEEWEGARGTISDVETAMYVIDEQGRRHFTPQHRHCAPMGSDTFSKLEPLAEKKGAMGRGRFGDAEVMLVSARGLRDIFASVMAIDNGVMLDKEPLDERFAQI